MVTTPGLGGNRQDLENGRKPAPVLTFSVSQNFWSSSIYKILLGAALSRRLMAASETLPLRPFGPARFACRHTPAARARRPAAASLPFLWLSVLSFHAEPHAQKARRDLGWKPRFAALDQIIAHAWEWERSGRNGLSKN